MLILSRKHGVRIQIGNDLTVTVLDIDGNRVRIGIDAPREVAVLRAELGERAKITETECKEPKK